MFGYEEEWEGYVASPWLDQPEPTIEQECSYHGHTYHGDDHPDAPDGMGGRCYCGEVRYPTGGLCRIEVRFDSTCMVVDAYWHCLTHDVSGDRRYETCDGAQEAAKWQHKVSVGGEDRVNIGAEQSAPATPAPTEQRSGGSRGGKATPAEGPPSHAGPPEQRSAALGSPGGRTIGSSDRPSPAADTCSAGMTPGSAATLGAAAPAEHHTQGSEGGADRPASTAGTPADDWTGTAAPDESPAPSDESGPGSSLSKSPGPEGGEGAVNTPAPDLPTTLIHAARVPGRGGLDG
jgi:hypothetical protein